MQASVHASRTRPNMPKDQTLCPRRRRKCPLCLRPRWFELPGAFGLHLQLHTPAFKSDHCPFCRDMLENHGSNISWWTELVWHLEHETPGIEEHVMLAVIARQ